jgi:hypothetical protein
LIYLKRYKKYWVDCHRCLVFNILCRLWLLVVVVVVAGDDSLMTHAAAAAAASAAAAGAPADAAELLLTGPKKQTTKQVGVAELFSGLYVCWTPGTSRTLLIFACVVPHSLGLNACS